jgi:16S rRNA (guanine966-N2)-methyltransferase
VRVIAGKLKGRSILSPSTEPIRPTSDRVRQAIFNILEHGGAGRPIKGARVLDLFAGTGAFGIEALSRGAAHCLFVETGAGARGLIRRSLAMLNVDRFAQVMAEDATRLGAPPEGHTFDLVFIDPPYGKGLAQQALAALAANRWLADGATVVVEEEAAARVAWPDAFEVVEQRRWGDTQAIFARAAPH